MHAGGQGFEPLILHQPERVSTLKTEYIYFVYKQVNNENEIEIKYKVFFQNFVGSERSEYNFNVKPRKPEKRKKLSLRVK